MKIEADSDSVIDYPHEDMPTMGMSHFLSLGRSYITTRGLMFSVCFFLHFLLFLFIFHFFTKTGQWTRTRTKIGLKDNVYIEGIEAVFQRDPLRAFEGRGFLPVWRISNHGLTAPGSFTLCPAPIFSCFFKNLCVRFCYFLIAH